MADAASQERAKGEDSRPRVSAVGDGGCLGGCGKLQSGAGERRLRLWATAALRPDRAKLQSGRSTNDQF